MSAEDNALGLLRLRDELGVTYIPDAGKNTLRGIFHADVEGQNKFGFKMAFDANPRLINGVHLSSSWLEALRETVVWGGKLNDQPLAKKIKKAGVSFPKLEAILQKKSQELFDAAENLETEEEVVALVVKFVSEDRAMTAINEGDGLPAGIKFVLAYYEMEKQNEAKLSQLKSYIRQGLLRAGPGSDNAVEFTQEDQAYLINTKHKSSLSEITIKILNQNSPDDAADEIKEFKSWLGQARRKTLKPFFLYTAGMISTTLSALHDHGVFDLFNNENGGFRSITMDEIMKYIQNQAAPYNHPNDQYLHGVMRLLSSLDWLTRNGRSASRDMEFTLTDKGKEAIQIVSSFSEVANFLPEAIKLEDYIMGREVEPMNADSLTIREIVELAGRNWDLPEISNKELVKETLYQLNGYLVGPLLLAMNREGIFESVDADLTLNINTLNGNEEWLDSIFELFAQPLQDFVYRSGDLVNLTLNGLVAFDRASSFGVPVSYDPSYKLAKEFLFGDVSKIERERPDKSEALVDRGPNVDGSGAAHSRYFRDAGKLQINSINEKIEKGGIPAIKELKEASVPFILAFSDTGSGNGAYLKYMYDVIMDQTKYGDLVREHPEQYKLELMGFDFNGEAREKTRATLEGAGIEGFYVDFGDISEPHDIVRRAKENIDERFGETARRSFIHSRTFLDHNRIWHEVKDKEALARRIAKSTGTYGRLGRAIPNEQIEQNYYEHMKAWADALKEESEGSDSEGELVVIELHTIAEKAAAENLSNTLDISYWLSHLYSDQFIVEWPVSNALNQEAGWGNMGEPITYPKGKDELTTVSIVQLRMKDESEELSYGKTLEGLDNLAEILGRFDSLLLEIRRQLQNKEDTERVGMAVLIKGTLDPLLTDALNLFESLINDKLIFKSEEMSVLVKRLIIHLNKYSQVSSEVKRSDVDRYNALLEEYNAEASKNKDDLAMAASKLPKISLLSLSMKEFDSSRRKVLSQLIVGTAAFTVLGFCEGCSNPMEPDLYGDMNSWTSADLMAVLGSGEWEEQKTAAQILYSRGHAEGVHAVIELLVKPRIQGLDEQNEGDTSEYIRSIQIYSELFELGEVFIAHILDYVENNSNRYYKTSVKASVLLIGDLGKEEHLLLLDSLNDPNRYDENFHAVVQEAIDTLLARMGVSTWTIEELVEGLLNVSWLVQRSCAIEIYNRNDEQRIITAQKVLVYPRINTLTSDDPNTINTRAYKRLIELGQIAISPLRGSVRRASAVLNTKVWSIYLLGEIYSSDDFFKFLEEVSVQYVEYQIPRDTLVGIIVKSIKKQEDSLALAISYTEHEEGVMREAAVVAMGEIPSSQEILPLLLNIKDNDIDEIVREKAAYSAHEVIYNYSNVNAFNDDFLFFVINSHHWDSRKEAGQQFYIRGNEAGIEVARNQIVWPYIRSLTGSHPRTTSTTNYRRIIAMGEISQVPLMENLMSRGAQTNTRKWSGRLLCHVGVFDEIIDELLVVIHTAETGGLYRWWHETEVRRGMPTLFARQTTGKLIELLEHPDSVVRSYAQSELNNRNNGKSQESTDTRMFSAEDNLNELEDYAMMAQSNELTQKLIGVRPLKSGSIRRYFNKLQDQKMIRKLGDEEVFALARKLEIKNNGQTPAFKMAFPDFQKEVELVRELITGERSVSGLGQKGLSSLGSNKDAHHKIKEIVFYEITENREGKDRLLKLPALSHVESDGKLHVYSMAGDITGIFHEIYERLVLPLRQDVSQGQTHTLAVLAETGLSEKLIMPRVKKQFSLMEIKDILGFLRLFPRTEEEINNKFDIEKVKESRASRELMALVRARRSYAIAFAKALHHKALARKETLIIQRDKKEEQEQKKKMIKLLSSLEGIFNLAEADDLAEDNVISVAKEFLSQAVVVRTGGTLEMLGAEGRANQSAIDKMVAKFKGSVGYSEKVLKNLPDSTNVGLEEWRIITKKLHKIIQVKREIEIILNGLGIETKRSAGIVVTTGTDTVDQLGLILSLNFSQTFYVPIVLTAAAIPLDQPDSDVEDNFLLALETATSSHFPPLVYFAYGNIVHLASRIKKFIAGEPVDKSSERLAENHRDFESYGDIVAIKKNGLLAPDEWIKIFFKARLSDESRKIRQLLFDNVEHVVISKDTPPEVLNDVAKRLMSKKQLSDGSLSSQNTSGLIIQGKKLMKHDHAGSKRMQEIVKKLIDLEIPVFVGSKDVAKEWKSSGVMLFPQYLAYAKARTKLAWLLNQGIVFKNIEAEMERHYIGETPYYEETISPWDDFPQSHVYETILENNYKAGLEVVVAYPGISVNIYQDAINRLALASGGVKQKLAIYGFGDGNLPLGDNNFDDPVLRGMETRFPGLSVEFKLNLELLLENTKDSNSLTPLELFELAMKNVLKRQETGVIERILEQYSLSMPRHMTATWINDAMKKAGKHQQKVFLAEPKRILANIKKKISTLKEMPPMEGTAKSLMEIKTYINKYLQSLSSADLARVFQEEPMYLARRVLKDSLMEGNETLRILGEAEDQGIQVDVFTIASRSRSDGNYYALGNMLLAVGVDSQKTKGWNDSLVPKSVIAKTAKGDDAMNGDVEGLIKLLSVQTRSVRIAAIEGLIKSGKESAIKPLSELLGDLDYEVHVSAKNALRKLSSDLEISDDDVYYDVEKGSWWEKDEDGVDRIVIGKIYKYKSNGRIVHREKTKKVADDAMAAFNLPKLSLFSLSAKKFDPVQRERLRNLALGTVAFSVLGFCEGCGLLGLEEEKELTEQEIIDHLDNLAIADPDEARRHSSYSAILGTGEYASLILIAYAEDTENNTDSRKWALKLLGNIGEFDTVFSFLASVARGRVSFAWWHELEARRGLTRLFERQTLEHNLEYIDHGNREVRSALVYALSSFEDEDAVDALIEMMQTDAYYFVRWIAAGELGTIGNPRAVPALIRRMLYDNNENVRWYAAHSLNIMEDVRAVEPFIQVLRNDEGQYVRSNAAAGLGKLLDPRAIEPLSEAVLNDPSGYVRSEATSALYAFKDPDTIPVFVEALNDTSWQVLYWAIIAAEHFKDSRAVPGLSRILLEHMEGTFAEDSRESAAKALGVIGDESALPALEQARDNDSSQKVREAAREAIERIQNGSAKTSGQNETTKDVRDVSIEKKIIQTRIEELQDRLNTLSQEMTKNEKTLQKIDPEFYFLMTQIELNNAKLSSLESGIDFAMAAQVEIEKVSREVRIFAQEAGQIMLEWRAGDMKVELKPDGIEEVTKADKAIQKRADEVLPRIIPGSVIIGEEHFKKGEPEVARKIIEKAKKTKYVWIVDPIDGTKHLKDKKNNGYDFAVALLEWGKPVYALIYAPEFDLDGSGSSRWEAFADREGVFLNDKLVEMDTSNKGLSDAKISYYRSDKVSPAGFFAEVVGSAHEAVFNSGGSGFINIGRLVASKTFLGGEVLYLKPTPSVWDILQGAFLMVKAGGVVTYDNGEDVFPLNMDLFDLSKGTPRLPTVIGGAPKVHAAALQIAKRYVEGDKAMTSDVAPVLALASSVDAAQVDMDAINEIHDQAMAGMEVAVTVVGGAIGFVGMLFWLDNWTDWNTVSGLIEHLRDSDPENRGKAASTLGGMEDDLAIGPLLGLLSDPDADVRKAVVEALENLGVERKQSTDALAEGRFDDAMSTDVLDKLAADNPEWNGVLNVLKKEMPDIVGRKQNHVQNVARNLFYLTAQDYESLFALLSDEEKGKTTFDEYAEQLERLYQVYLEMSEKDKEALYLTVIFHDVGAVNGGRDWMHHQIGSERVKNLLKSLVSENDVVERVSRLIYSHGMITNVGVDFFPYEFVSLSEEDKDVLMIMFTLDQSGRQDNINNATLSILKALSEYRNNLINDLSTDPQQFAEYRLGRLLTPFLMPEEKRRENYEKISDALVSRGVEMSGFIENWSSVIRVNVFAIFLSLANDDFNLFIDLLVTINDKVNELRSSGREISEIVLDADEDFMGMPFEGEESKQRADIMYAIVSALKAKKPIPMTFEKSAWGYDALVINIARLVAAEEDWAMTNDRSTTERSVFGQGYDLAMAIEQQMEDSDSAMISVEGFSIDNMGYAEFEIQAYKFLAIAEEKMEREEYLEASDLLRLLALRTSGIFYMTVMARLSVCLRELADLSSMKGQIEKPIELESIYPELVDEMASKGQRLSHLEILEITPQPINKILYKDMYERARFRFVEAYNILMDDGPEVVAWWIFRQIVKDYAYYSDLRKSSWVKDMFVYILPVEEYISSQHRETALQLILEWDDRLQKKLKMKELAKYDEAAFWKRLHGMFDLKKLAQGYSEEAFLKRKQGDYPAAIELLNKAISGEPEVDLYKQQLAQVYYEKGEKKKAARIFADIEQLDEYDPFIYVIFNANSVFHERPELSRLFYLWRDEGIDQFHGENFKAAAVAMSRAIVYSRGGYVQGGYHQLGVIYSEWGRALIDSSPEEAVEYLIIAARCFNASNYQDAAKDIANYLKSNIDSNNPEIAKIMNGKGTDKAMTSDVAPVLALASSVDAAKTDVDTINAVYDAAMTGMEVAVTAGVGAIGLLGVLFWLDNWTDWNTVSGLIEHLRDSEPENRERAARTLGGMEDDLAIRPILDLLSDTDVNVRKTAMETLEEIEGERKQSTDALAEGRSDDAMAENDSRGMVDNLRSYWESSLDFFGLYEQKRRNARPAIGKIIEGVLRGALKEEGDILEVGSGQGELMRYVPGDVQERFVQADLVQKFLRESSSRSRKIVADAYSLPFQNETMSSVVSHAFFDAIFDIRSAAEEMQRVLLPGGTMIGITDFAPNHTSMMQQSPGQILFPTDVIVPGQEISTSMGGFMVVDRQEFAAKIQQYLLENPNKMQEQHFQLAVAYYKDPVGAYMQTLRSGFEMQMLAIRTLRSVLDEVGVEYETYNQIEYFKKKVEESVVTVGFEILESELKKDSVLVDRGDLKDIPEDMNVVNYYAGLLWLEHDSVIPAGKVKIVATIYSLVAQKKEAVDDAMSAAPVLALTSSVDVAQPDVDAINTVYDAAMTGETLAVVSVFGTGALIITWLRHWLSWNVVNGQIMHLDDLYDANKIKAMRLLARSKERAAVDHLVELFTHMNRDVKLEAIKTVGEIGDKKATEALVQLLQSSNYWPVRKAAIEAIGEIKDERAIEHIKPFLSDNIEEVRIATEEVLEKLKSADQAMIVENVIPANAGISRDSGIVAQTGRTDVSLALSSSVDAAQPDVDAINAVYDSAMLSPELKKELAKYHVTEGDLYELARLSREEWKELIFQGTLGSTVPLYGDSADEFPGFNVYRYQERDLQAYKVKEIMEGVDPGFRRENEINLIAFAPISVENRLIYDAFRKRLYVSGEAYFRGRRPEGVVLPVVISEEIIKNNTDDELWELSGLLETVLSSDKAMTGENVIPANAGISELSLALSLSVDAAQPDMDTINAVYDAAMTGEQIGLLAAFLLGGLESRKMMKFRAQEHFPAKKTSFSDMFLMGFVTWLVTSGLIGVLTGAPMVPLSISFGIGWWGFFAIKSSSGGYMLADYPGSVEMLKKHRAKQGDEAMVAGSGLSDKEKELIAAAFTGDEDTVFRILLEGDIDINKTDETGQTSLLWATRGKQENIKQVLIAHGAEQYSYHTYEDGRGVLYDKREDGSYGPIYYDTLVSGESAPAEVSKEVYRHEFFKAVDDGNIQMVVAFIKMGFDVDTLDLSNRTASYFAVQEGPSKILELLLEAGANPNAKDDEGESLLYVAADTGNYASVAILIEYRVNVNAQNRKRLAPLHPAANRGHFDIVNLLIKHDADVNIRDINNRSVLLYAERGGHTAIVELLEANNATRSEDDYAMTTNISSEDEREESGLFFAEGRLRAMSGKHEEAMEGSDSVDLAMMGENIIPANAGISELSLALSSSVDVAQPDVDAINAVYDAAMMGVVEVVVIAGAGILSLAMLMRAAKYSVDANVDMLKNHKNADIRFIAAKVLFEKKISNKKREKIIDAFESSLFDFSDDIRLLSVMALRKFGLTNKKRAFRKLLKLALGNDNEKIKTMAAFTIVDFDPLSEEAGQTIETLIDLLYSGDVNNRLLSGIALGQLAGRASEAIPVLYQRSRQEPNIQVKAIVASAIAEINPASIEAKQSVPLLKSLQDNMELNADDRSTVKTALSKISDNAMAADDGGIDHAQTADLKARGIDSSLEKDVGGIDMNNIEIDRAGTSNEIQFDVDAMQPLLDMNITGFAPIIIDIVPLPSIMPVLGLKEIDKDKQRAKGEENIDVIPAEVPESQDEIPVSASLHRNDKRFVLELSAADIKK